MKAGDSALDVDKRSAGVDHEELQALKRDHSDTFAWTCARTQRHSEMWVVEA